MKFRYLPIVLAAAFAATTAFAGDFVKAPRGPGKEPQEKEISGITVKAAPQAMDAEELKEAPQEGTPRNIIYIIGDGMGQGSLRFTSLFLHSAYGKLFMEQLPAKGLLLTYSASSMVTDSAASGTALSSGYKTNNHTIGMTPDKKKYKSIAAVSLEAGKSVGVITNDPLTGATPSAFIGHVPSRTMSDELAADAAKCGYDILIGNQYDKPFRPADALGSRKDGRNLCEEMEDAGYIRVNSLDEFKSAEAGKKVLGFLPAPTEDTENLSLIAATAFERLNKNPKGFFLVIENTYADHGGHNNKPELTLNAVAMTDFVVQKAIEFALKNKDTLVVVTADHETGGIQPVINVNAQLPHVYYGSTGHTGDPVPLFAFGPGSAFFNGIHNNIEVAPYFAKLWGLKTGLEAPIE